MWHGDPHPCGLELDGVDARIVIDVNVVDRRSRYYLASCRECDRALAVGDVEATVVDLAVRNATARPCCRAWIPVDLDAIDDG